MSLHHYSVSELELLEQLRDLKNEDETEIYSYCSSHPFKVDTIIDLLERWINIEYGYSQIVLSLINLCVE